MEQRLEQAKPAITNEIPQSMRKEYAIPRLFEFGSVAKLTRGGGSKNNDNGPRTKAFRAPDSPAPKKKR